jgi:hypothetical protein
MGQDDIRYGNGKLAFMRSDVRRQSCKPYMNAYNIGIYNRCRNLCKQGVITIVTVSEFISMKGGRQS